MVNKAALASSTCLSMTPMDAAKITHAYSTDYAQGLNDLDANRAGFIPIGQKRWLWRRWWRQQVPQIIGIVLISVGVVASAWFSQLLPRWDDEALILAGVFFILAFALNINLLVKWLQHKEELAHGVVSAVNGNVSLQTGNGYSASIGKLAFKISQDLYLNLNEQDQYRLYYTPQSKILLTAEKLSDE